MRLLNVLTGRLETFMDDREIIGRYAILSHTWEEDEVTYDDVDLPRARQMRGWRKIDLTCRQARLEGLRYAWIDTCCIDKKSSAELTTALNSMYRWYYNAKVCYVYLSDQSSPKFNSDDQAIRATQECRWYTRGWTLQELIAPLVVKFYDSDWSYLGSKSDQAHIIAEISGIDADILQSRDKLAYASVAKRMSWAANRTTKVVEDEAYCLFGIFQVNMPLLYGEGRKSFIRLQEEIIRTYPEPDHSMLAWRSTTGDLLAPSPASFGFATDAISWSLPQGSSFDLNNRGLKINAYRVHSRHLQLATLLSQNFDPKDCLFLALDCCPGSQLDKRTVLTLRRRPDVVSLRRAEYAATTYTEGLYDRAPELLSVNTSALDNSGRAEVTIARTPFRWPPGNKVRISHSSSCTIQQRHTGSSGVRLVPEGDWVPQEGTLHLARLDLIDHSSHELEYGRFIVSDANGSQVSVGVVLGRAKGSSPSSSLASLYIEELEGLASLSHFDKKLERAAAMRNGHVRSFRQDSHHGFDVLARLVILGGEVVWNLHFDVIDRSANMNVT